MSATLTFPCNLHSIEIQCKPRPPGPPSNSCRSEDVNHWLSPTSTKDFIRRPRLSHPTSSPDIIELAVYSLAFEGELFRQQQTLYNARYVLDFQFLHRKGKVAAAPRGLPRTILSCLVLCVDGW
ncbi:hypothetical protein AVEN_68843-1 [Araneus ventricosus]|uniref:Uncharacterized protein n=1 Tax=Araneus ventricosus TaxID=182803 RepID=A0A4Y2C542_ARAVE|nr:hypothetical protein AVEN_68843-1 [Araneus ventricosus]